MREDSAPSKSLTKTRRDKVNGFPESDIDVSELLHDSEKLSATAEANEMLFAIKPTTTWMMEAHLRPESKMLFDAFILEGDLTILYGETGGGKTIGAFQVADSITTGNQISGFRNETTPQPLLYIDHELTDKMVEKRYSVNYDRHYQFSKNFLRAEVNPDSSLPAQFKSFEEFLYYSIERGIKDTGAKILVIDNITYLKDETERAKFALPLMKHLQALKKRYSLTVLVLAHCPKRDSSKPLGRNDLQGSKMLINFCDAAFAIGESAKDPSLRYLKQIKARNTELIYDSDNVVVCELTKPYNFIGFEFRGYDRESNHLTAHTEKTAQERDAQIIALSSQGLSLREIGKQLGISHQTAKRILEKQKAAVE